MRRRVLIPVLLVGLAACDAFSARTPEDPITERGTYVQPDQPEQVVDNLQAAIRELNTQNYRRSLADDFTFEPAATAQQSASVWSNWNREAEVSYFTQMAEAARTASGHELRLNEPAEDFTEDRFVLDANYFLVVHHRRPEVPDTVQGHLVWEITQGTDGLWRLYRWTDQELGGRPTWSDLKAEFTN